MVIEKAMARKDKIPIQSIRKEAFERFLFIHLFCYYQLDSINEAIQSIFTRFDDCFSC